MTEMAYLNRFLKKYIRMGVSTSFSRDLCPTWYHCLFFKINCHLLLRICCPFIDSIAVLFQVYYFISGSNYIFRCFLKLILTWKNIKILNYYFFLIVLIYYCKKADLFDIFKIKNYFCVLSSPNDITSTIYYCCYYILIQYYECGVDARGLQKYLIA
jgi:hypothetical protein